MKFYALACLLVCVSAHAQNASDIRVYFPNHRVSYYYGCDVTQYTPSEPAVLSANCSGRFENEPGNNPLPNVTPPSIRLVIFGITPGVSPWYLVSGSNAGSCTLQATYAVPFPGTGYIAQCDGADLIYGDTFDGCPVGEGGLGC